MVKVNYKALEKSAAKFKKASLYVGGGALLLTGFFSCSSEAEYETSEVLSPTQGIITEVKEIEAEKFRILDETIVAKKEDSRIIAEYMDGVRDTFTLDEARLVDSENPRRRGMSGILMGGMMGYMMGKSMKTPVSSGAYANNNAYQKSAKTTNSLKSTATRKTVRTPKKGFGSSKSTRSYGG